MAVTKITGAGLGLPNADGNALGGASNEWSDLYLADGGLIYLGNDQDINITHVADTGITTSGTFQATTITATTAVVPDASDGAALGTTSLEFSDLFLADGAVINFGDDQDITLTHSADVYPIAALSPEAVSPLGSKVVAATIRLQVKLVSAA